jgi:hypothetical protein
LSTGFSSYPKVTPPRILTGHIDFLQVRNGAVHILDYKPDARTNKPIAQLTLYALALTRLAGLRLFDIKCAWFNEEQYCEFFPRSLLAHPQPRGGGEAGHLDNGAGGRNRTGTGLRPTDFHTSYGFRRRPLNRPRLRIDDRDIYRAMISCNARVLLACSCSQAS